MTRQVEMTKINFKSSGEVAGWETNFTIDLDRLTPNEADHLLLLIDKANFFKLPSFIGQPVQYEFRYRITVETNARCHSVRFSESTMPESLRPLLEELSSLAVMV